MNRPSTLVGFGAVVAVLLLLMWFLEPRKKVTLDFPVATPMHFGVGNTTSVVRPQIESAAGQPGWLVAKPSAAPNPSPVLQEKAAAVEAVAPASPPQKTVAAAVPKPSVAAPPPLVPAQIAARPSFDCATAVGQVDRLICSDDELAKRDVELAVLYRRAMAVVADPSEMASQQHDWIALRRNPCSSKACLLSAYADRRRELLDWVGR